eukprot:gb/GECH01000932.1/.p1 GENE.gb/GECH01000932.1/~~gb/GECH01000932.1/.p1  ORF type:complete len:405 (+),score=102.59 gb/GECH01000932.1/:1-1215(+)
MRSAFHHTTTNIKLSSISTLQSIHHSFSVHRRINNHSLIFSKPIYSNNCFYSSMSSPTDNNFATQLNIPQVYYDVPEACNTSMIGTHDGKFHCDEALACALLKITKKFQDAIVVRSRNPDILRRCSVVVDVGGAYNPDNHRYDHHMREFTDTLDQEHQTKLSSAGLIYKHFGKEILSQFFKEEHQKEYLDEIYQKVYTNFIEHIDGIDNGINVSTSGEVNYNVTTSLSSRVGRLNPMWNEVSTEGLENERFKKAMKLTGSEFLECVHYLINGWLPARKYVVDAVNKRNEIDSSGEIICMETFCPWKEHLLDVEKEKGIEGQIKYCLFQDTRGAWRIQAVPLEPESFDNRMPLPEAWRGLRDSDLNAKSGVEGCIFVHASGFIGGNKTYDGALDMARKALEINKQ